MNNHQQKITALPFGRAEANLLFEQFNNVVYRIIDVRSVCIKDIFHCRLVKNPKRRGFWGLFMPKYVPLYWVHASMLCVNDSCEGRLQGGYWTARKLQSMFADPSQRPVDLIVRGHFNESGWTIDHIEVQHYLNATIPDRLR
ncbi:MAG: hypothetical protein SGJ27_31135 [Candidatus Melainabacteria bacterium]|nr:hypothetical protein [Candidatus Melainabacteria bacterium]